MRKLSHPLEYPLVIKQVGEYITVSIPDHGVSLSEIVGFYPKFDTAFMTRLNSLILKAEKRVIDRMKNLEAIEKKEWRPPSKIKESVSIDSKDLFSTREAAKILGVSEATLKRWESSGKIKATKTLGGHRKFRPSEISEKLKTLNTEVAL